MQTVSRVPGPPKARPGVDQELWPARELDMNCASHPLVQLVSLAEQISLQRQGLQAFPSARVAETAVRSSSVFWTLAEPVADNRFVSKTVDNSGEYFNEVAPSQAM